MKLAGMFIELGRLRPPTPQPSIRDHVGAPLPDVEAVADYLGGGHELITAMDLSRDVFDESRDVMNGSSIRTDGEWLWRDDLAYYVSRHDVALPEEFLRAIRDRNYVVPDLDDATLDAAADHAVHLVSF
jgi:hypothetical protein